VDLSTRKAWFDRLPHTLGKLELQWSITIHGPFPSETAFVAAVTLADGTAAVLKIGMPHMEADHELAGLLFWNGDPTVRVLKSDTESNAILLERCYPGSSLDGLPEEEQDEVFAGLLRKLWVLPEPPHPFRPLAQMLKYWSDETMADIHHWPDSGMVRDGLRLFQELPSSAPNNALLATDLHAGNVLRAQRKPWLVIDPKPFIGDPAYDATQHLFNCTTRMRAAPFDTIHRFADLLEVDAERVRLWMFARAAAEPRARWDHEESMALSRALARGL